MTTYKVGPAITTEGYKVVIIHIDQKNAYGTGITAFWHNAFYKKWFPVQFNKDGTGESLWFFGRLRPNARKKRGSKKNVNQRRTR